LKRYCSNELPKRRNFKCHISVVFNLKNTLESPGSFFLKTPMVGHQSRGVHLIGLGSRAQALLIVILPQKIPMCNQLGGCSLHATVTGLDYYDPNLL
jgi:hypothetical protein